MILPTYSKTVQKKTVHIEIGREEERMMKQIGQDVNNWQIWVKVTQECLVLSLPMSFKFYKNKN